MRELKFREFVNGKFHYWGFTQEGIFKGPVTPSLTRGSHQQFTGLKDKNGKEIYEGDILEYSEGNNYVIEWWEEGACWFPRRLGDLPVTYGTTFKSLITRDKVVGNIYENPELL